MTKLVSIGLFALMIIGFIEGLSPVGNKTFLKQSNEFRDAPIIPLSDQIKLARLEKNISQQQLAQKTELTKYNIEAIEAGDAVPSGEVLRRFEKALDTNLSNLR